MPIGQDMFEQEDIRIKKAAKPEGGARSWKDDLGKDKAWGQCWRRGQGKQKADRWGGSSIRTSSEGDSVGEGCLYSRKESCSHCSSKVGFQIWIHSLKGRVMTLKWQAPISGHCLVSMLSSSWTGLHTVLSTCHKNFCF